MVLRLKTWESRSSPGLQKSEVPSETKSSENPLFRYVISAALTFVRAAFSFVKFNAASLSVFRLCIQFGRCGCCARKAAELGRSICLQVARWAAGLELGCGCVVMMAAGNFNRLEVVVVSASPRRALIRELLRSTVWPFGSAVRSSIHVLAVDERG